MQIRDPGSGDQDAGREREVRENGDAEAKTDELHGCHEKQNEAKFQGRRAVEDGGKRRGNGPGLLKGRK